ncbi:MAG: cytochrome c [Gammaproteobacteria bacterium]|nr:cytochrome c [Gammaproteobacteria bacterium]
MIPCVLWLTTVGVLTFGQSEASIWDGVYSEEQAVRGASGYQEVCASCHAEDLRGDNNSPSLIGVSFLFLWEERSLGDLFAKIQTEMPPANPNSLPSGSYLDILAYLLQVNGFPGGEEKLRIEPGKHDRVLITGKPRSQ